MTFIHYMSFANEQLFENQINDKPKVRVCKFRVYPRHLVPHFNFNAENDCTSLSEALEGSGTNEQCIIDIITTRSNAQRQAIAVRYNLISLGRDLSNDLNDKCGGKFRDIIIGLMTPLNEYLCKELNTSLTGFTTDEDALVEILCTKTNKEMTQLIESYDKLYNRPLVEHLCSGTGGYFRRLLIMIVTGSRDQSNVVDPILVEEHAAALDDIGKGYPVADNIGKINPLTVEEDVYSRILSHDNFALLRKVFDEYKNVSGQTIEEAVVHDMCGDLKQAMLAIIESVHSGPAFFAKRLFLAMDGMITSDATIMRIIISRSEIDLGLIKSEFERLYDQTLLSVVKNKTSGDYKHVLCRIIG